MSSTVRIVTTLRGKPRLERTRVGVFQVGELVRRRDWSVDDVTGAFDLHPAALDDYDTHPELIETLRAQHRAAVRSRREASRAE